MQPHCLAALVLVLGCQAALAQRPPEMLQPPPTRGKLLYDTHCIACHNSEIHWLDNKAATDWASLKAQVRRWQERAHLQWSEADIVEVARYLNDTIYRYRQTSDLVGQVGSRP
jgi:mono/diheme cytochrome c family protein